MSFSLVLLPASRSSTGCTTHPSLRPQNRKVWQQRFMHLSIVSFFAAILFLFKKNDYDFLMIQCDIESRKDKVKSKPAYMEKRESYLLKMMEKTRSYVPVPMGFVMHEKAIEFQPSAAIDLDTSRFCNRSL
jgi:hypothetical protein